MPCFFGMYTQKCNWWFISISCPGWRWTSDFSASASWMLELYAHCHHAWLVFFFWGTFHSCSFIHFIMPLTVCESSLSTSWSTCFLFCFYFFETRSHQLAQAALELVISHASASQVLRWQVCTSHWLFLFLSLSLFFKWYLVIGILYCACKPYFFYFSSETNSPWGSGLGMTILERLEEELWITLFS